MYSVVEMKDVHRPPNSTAAANTQWVYGTRMSPQASPWKSVPFSTLNLPLGALELRTGSFLLPKVSPGASLPAPHNKLPFGIPELKLIS